MLNGKSLFRYRNYSAPKEKPLALNNSKAPKTEVKAALDRKIKPVNAVLVLSGMYYNHREWMQYEIEKSVELGKPIIAIKPPGNSIIPKEIQETANAIVGWNTESIVDAIRRYSL